MILSHNFKLKLFLRVHMSVGVELINKLHRKMMIPSHNFKLEIFLCVHRECWCKRERETKNYHSWALGNVAFLFWSCMLASQLFANSDSTS